MKENCAEIKDQYVYDRIYLCERHDSLVTITKKGWYCIRGKEKIRSPRQLTMVVTKLVPYQH